MIKRTTYGFNTPVRREVKNITGNKVVGELTGSEVILKNINLIRIEAETVFEDKIVLDKTNANKLFLSENYFLGIGGYFYANHDISIELGFMIGNEEIVKKNSLSSEKWSKFGTDYEISEEDFQNNEISIVIRIENLLEDITEVYYSNFNGDFVSTDDYVDNIEFYRHYSNAKKEICFPEQFYFNSERTLSTSIVSEFLLPLKSCNRCQRYLPINPLNEREQLGFTNHCTSKAPCTHKGFSIYKVSKDFSELKSLIYDKNTYKVDLEDYTLMSYYGHQLECKACKKFYVNAALNHKRTSTQHREDSLRRRAIELLCGKLLDKKWIYHEFRVKTGKEFDKYIYEKFDKKCFKCNKKIESVSKMHLDHTMPLSHFYPLDETATCLCGGCNSEKSDKLPRDFYNSSELEALAKITGINIELLSSDKPNQIIVNLIKENLKWVITKFLQHPDYLKERDGKRAYDSILHSIQKIINKSETPFSIEDEIKSF